jgi:hypothetical protein
MDRRTFWSLYLLALAVMVIIGVAIVRAADARIYERLQ